MGAKLGLALTIIVAVVGCGTPAKSPETPTTNPTETMLELPDTHAGRQLAECVRLFNDANEREAYRAFMETNYPSGKLDPEAEWQFREMTGGFELRKVEESSPTRLVVLMQERASDQFARFTLEVEGREPYIITTFERRGIPTPPEFAVPRLSESELVAALKARLDADSASDQFSGAVLLAHHGEIVFAHAYGLADREKRIANTLDTRFRIGSMNKMFTGTAIVQLAQAGKLSLEAPIGAYLTDYPNPDTARVTIAQLLTHTGGTGDIFGPEFDAHRLELRALADYVGLYGGRAPEFEPGTEWAYSNYGFILLGLVVERVSGQSYYDYVHKHIFELAGMTSSGSMPEDQNVPGRSIGYTKNEDRQVWERNTDTLPYRGTSAGGGYSTVGDLLRFAIALKGHALLDAEHTELLTTGKVDTPGGGRYGYGFGELAMDELRCFGHTGGAPGMGGALWACPASGYVLVVLANVDPLAMIRISDFIANRMPAPAE